jgi:hypothetical protein
MCGPTTTSRGWRVTRPQPRRRPTPPTRRRQTRSQSGVWRSCAREQPASQSLRRRPLPPPLLAACSAPRVISRRVVRRRGTGRLHAPSAKAAATSTCFSARSAVSWPERREEEEEEEEEKEEGVVGGARRRVVPAAAAAVVSHRRRWTRSSRPRPKSERCARRVAWAQRRWVWASLRARDLRAGTNSLLHLVAAAAVAAAAGAVATAVTACAACAGGW